MNLAEKTYSMVSCEAPGNRDPMAEMWERAPDDPEAARDWAMMFGIACGIARTEDLWESTGDVVGRALEAANEVYRRYTLPDAPSPKEAVA